MNKILVAVNTGVLRYALVAWLDLNRVMVVLQSKGYRVKEAVVSLCPPLTDEIVRHVTVIASCRVVVTALLPRVKMILHDVAVCAGLWVVAEVACPFAVAKRERAYASENSQQHGESDEGI